MYNILGILNGKDVTNPLFHGLQQLEHDGYDSIRIATVMEGQIQSQQAEGLQSLLSKLPLQGRFGIAYTRWTNQDEAPLHHIPFYATERVAIVHNGMIENYRELRHELIKLGYEFETQTDSEVLLRLISRYLDIGLSPTEAMSVTLMRLHGFFAIIALFAEEEGNLIAARRGHPLAIGLGESALYVGSDINTLTPLANQILELEEGCPAVLSSLKMNISKVCQ